MAKKISNKIYGELKGEYAQKSVKRRIEALFLDNIGKILTRELIIKVSTDPETGRQPGATDRFDLACSSEKSGILL